MRFSEILTTSTSLLRLKCFNLERMIAAEEEGKDAPMPLEIEEYYSVEMDQVDNDNDE